MAIIVGTSGNDTLVGTVTADEMSGLDGNDTISAGTGDDELEGGSGDDRLYGGIGSDIMTGGLGNDWFFVDSLLDAVIEASGGGTADRVLASLNYTLAAGLQVEILSTTDLTGTAPIELTGNELANRIGGNAGNNVLDGGAGADVLHGWAGNDSYYVDSSSDVVRDDGVGQGTDQVFASANFALWNGVEIEVLATDDAAGTAMIHLTGNEFANDISGNAGVNALAGGDGDDTISGNLGNDQLFGANGDDTLNGGEGVDRLYGGAGNDFLTDESAGWPYSERDILAGGDGDDTYYSVRSDRQTIVELPDEGTDTVFALDRNYTLPDNFENLGRPGGAPNGPGEGHSNFTGNSVDNVITGWGGNDVLRGGGGNDTLVGFWGWDRLFGEEGMDTLDGGAGDDELDGGTGADTMAGGFGNDWYFIDDSGDTVAEAAGEGVYDRAFTSISYTLPAGLQVELVTTRDHLGTEAIDLTGNALANQLRGNLGANVLRGNAGNDILDGGGGADTLTGGTGSDTFSFSRSPYGPSIGVATIGDYVVAEDSISFDDSAFSSLPLGPLAESAFHVGSAAHDADDRVIYDPATGALWFDRDGNGETTAVQFATLSMGLAMTASEFIVV